MLIRSVRTALLVALLGVTTAAQTTHTVTAFSNFFTPQNITITAGDTVRWVNLQSNSHNVTQVDYPPTTSSVWNGGFWSGFGGDTDEYELTFTEVGLIAYICEPHVGHGMNGTIDVQAALVGEWDDLGGAVAGTAGTPVLAGVGDLLDGLGGLDPCLVLRQPLLRGGHSAGGVGGAIRAGGLISRG